MSAPSTAPTSRRTLAERIFGPRTIGVFFSGAGILHLVRPQLYEPIMPPQLPRHRELILLSGVAEIVGGALYLPRGSRTFASWWLLLLLIAVFPSNIYMTMQPRFQRSVPGGLPALLARLPLQFVGMWWVRELAKRSQAAGR
ncbi:MAG: hypothetical protein QM679_07660 [Patulibacter sp.]